MKIFKYLKMANAARVTEFLSQFEPIRESRGEERSLVSQFGSVANLRQQLADAQNQLLAELAETHSEISRAKRARSEERIKSTSRLTLEIPIEVRTWIERMGEEIGYYKFRELSLLEDSYKYIRNIGNGSKWGSYLLRALAIFIEKTLRVLSAEHNVPPFTFAKAMKIMFGEDNALWGIITDAMDYLRRQLTVPDHDLHYMDVIQALTMTYNLIYRVNRLEVTTEERQEINGRLRNYNKSPCSRNNCQSLRCIAAHGQDAAILNIMESGSKKRKAMEPTTPETRSLSDKREEIDFIPL